MMREVKSWAMILFSAIFILLGSTENTLAFGTGGHYVIMEAIIQNLDDNSEIGSAMKKYPEIAAWGAIGPDLGNATWDVLTGYTPWADRFHYDRIGSYAKKILQDALASQDQKKIAFAGGWVTHITGDLAGHGIFVNLEAGVYLDNPDGRELHKTLEKSAERYLWVNLADKVDADYDRLMEQKFAVNIDFPTTFFAQLTTSFYGVSLTESQVKGDRGFLTLYRAAWNSGAIKGLKYATALNNLNQGTRIKRLTDAFNWAVERGVTLLKEAE